MVCPSCGNAIADGSATCPVCAAPIGGARVTFGRTGAITALSILDWIVGAFRLETWPVGSHPMRTSAEDGHAGFGCCASA